MVINHIKHEFDVETQTEMFDLIKHLANCESFEVDGLKTRTIEAISDWIEEKARELRRRN